MWQSLFFLSFWWWGSTYWVTLSSHPELSSFPFPSLSFIDGDCLPGKTFFKPDTNQLPLYFFLIARFCLLSKDFREACNKNSHYVSVLGRGPFTWRCILGTLANRFLFCLFTWVFRSTYLARFSGYSAPSLLPFQSLLDGGDQLIWWQFLDFRYHTDSLFWICAWRQDC